ncbi:MAG TPA: porin [Burkholderiales bacterium]|nr:porin [Burkholderiales bacterium]
MNRKTTLAALALAAGALIAAPSMATDGYFQHGYGLKAKGMGGAATAMTDDAFGGANNPATMVFVGDRLDIGVDFFSPRRSAERSGSSPLLGPIDGSADSDSNLFAIPEFGYNKLLKPDLSLGVSVYGNGGMNTDYPGGQIPSASACAGFNTNPGPYNLLCGNGRLGVDLTQLVIAPTLSYKLTENQSIGVAPLLGVQRFALEGAQAFGGFSNSPSNLTNQGYDTSYGYGARVGWYGRVSDALSLGAAYSTKVYMTKFDKYKGLFADQGDFDMPENYNAGLAYRITQKVTIAADYQRINYSGVKAVGNPSSLLLSCAGGNSAACLGGSDGAGFGWSDVNVWKLGVEYQYSERLTLRGGYNHTDNPIQAKDVTINILAPGVVQDHATLGMTYVTRGGGEWTLAYMHAFQNSVTGPSFFNNFTGGTPAGNETIKMDQNAIGIAYGMKL